MVSVNATAVNTKFNYAIPVNQTQTVQTFVSLLTPGSPFLDQVTGGNNTVSGTYDIYAHLCLPSATAKPKAVQFLTHGIGFDGYYWDFAPGYSYVDAAAANGFATFFYDRLGVGQSSHPDALEVVQAAIQVEIANELIGMLRKGTFSNMAFGQVAALGHSFGSIITSGLVAQYPASVDAFVETAFSVNSSSLAPFTFGLDFGIANVNMPSKFGSLPNGYLTVANNMSLQLGFFHYNGFANDILQQAYAQTQTTSLGEMFSQFTAIKHAPNYMGLAAVVDGAEDLAFCYGNCSYPVNHAQQALSLVPKARNTTTYLAPNTGHGVNLHYSAPDTYKFIQNFFTSNGFKP